MNETARLILAVDSTDVSRADQALLGLGAQADRVERQTTRASDQIAGGFKVIGAAMAAVAGSAALRKIVGDLASFDQAMRGVQAVSGATAAEMAVLEKQARELGATSMFSAQQAADAQRFLAQAGFEVNEVLGATPGILQLAAASGMDLGSAADLASNALSGFRLEVSELNRVNDVLAATAASANTDVMQLGQALSFAAPIATAAGVSIEETSAAIGALSDAGLQASRAGTGFVGFIRQLSNVTPQAAEALASYGVSVSEVDISTRGLQPVIDRLAEANISTADAFQIFGSEAGAAAQILLGASGRVQELTDRLGDAEGAASRMAGILGEGLTGSLKGFGSAAAEATLQLGDGGMGGAMQTVIDTATGVLNAFNGLLPVMVDNEKITQDQAETYEALADSLGLLVTVVGTRVTASFAASTAAKVTDTLASVSSGKAQAAVAQSQMLAADQTVRRAAAELQAAQVIQARAVADAKATAGTNAHAIAMDHLAVSAARVTAAEAGYTAATNAAAAASTRAAAATKSATAAFALFGGPLGLVATGIGAVAYALYSFGEDQRNAKKDVDEFRQSLEQVAPPLDVLIEKYKEASKVQRQIMADEWLTRQETAVKAADAAFQNLVDSVEDLSGASRRADMGMFGGASSEVIDFTFRYRTALKEAYEQGGDLIEVINEIGTTTGISEEQLRALRKFAGEIEDSRKEGERLEDLLRRLGETSIDIDYAKSSRIANEIIGELNKEEEARQRATKAADDQFKSIQRRVEALQLEAETLGMTATQAELYRLRIEGATEAQIKDAEAALRARDAYNEQIAALEARNESLRYGNELIAEMEKERQSDISAGEKLLERYMDEEDILREHHERRLEILNAAREADFNNKERWDQAIAEEDQRHKDDLADLDDKRWKAQLKGTAQVFGMLAGLMSSENRKMFEIGKAAAIAQGLINIPLAASNAYSSAASVPGIGHILAPIAAAAAVVAQTAQLHAIQSTSFSGGGGAAGISGGIQTVPAAPAPIQLDGGGGSGESSGPSITISVSGSVVGSNGMEELVDIIKEGFKDSVNNRDEILIDARSRNGRLLSGR